MKLVKDSTTLKTRKIQTTVNIGLTNPKSPTNVGAVMRASGCYQVDAVFYTGNRYNRAKQYNTDTMDAHKTIPFTCVEDLSERATSDMQIICVELVEGAIPLPEFEHPEKALYIFGPEDGTIPQKVINKADAVVYIPTIGCLNLAQTVNVLLYDRLAKSNSNIASNELIFASRDKNNSARVKELFGTKRKK